jgi:uncharacterized membrane protein
VFRFSRGLWALCNASHGLCMTISPSVEKAAWKWLYGRNRISGHICRAYEASTTLYEDILLVIGTSLLGLLFYLYPACKTRLRTV